MLKICRSCGRHVREEKCPFCGGNACEPKCNLRPILGEKLTRAALVLGSALAISSCSKKGDEKVPSHNAIEPKPEAQETPSTQTETPTPSPSVTQSSWENTNQAEFPEPTVSLGPIPDIPLPTATTNEGPAVHYGGPPIRPRPEDIVHYGGPPMRDENISDAPVYGGPDFWKRKRGD